MESKNNIFEVLKEPTSNLILSVLSLLGTIPIFITAYRHMPIIEIPIGEGFRVGHILAFVIIFILLYLVIRKFSKIAFVLSGIGFVALMISSFTGHYGIRNFYYDYAALLANLQEHGVQLNFEEKKDPFTRQAQIVFAADYDTPDVRNTALNWATKNFSAYRLVAPSNKVIHALSIYKEVRSRWRYVSDPMGRDYYSKASETFLQLQADDKLKGDCDDYSIVMGALIKAIGGEVNLVRTKVNNPDGSVTGHLYPEVYIGDEKDLEQVAYLIKNKLFPEESKDKLIYYYTDAEGKVWLNFDYNDHYPGAHYQSLLREAVLPL